MSSYLNLKNVICALLVCLFSFGTQAQCDNYGVVQSGPDECGMYLLDFATGNLLEITSAEFDLEEGTVLAYSYTEAGSTYNCGAWSVSPVSLSCIDEVNDELTLGIMCNYGECIYPGDADADLKANVTDLLNIGIGYGTSGPARPFAHENWEAQIGPDWAESTAGGINYKHLDSNGDGLIDEADIDAVMSNYIPETQNFPESYTEGAPELTVDFDVDTIYFDFDSPEFIEVTATVQLDNADDIHGLSFMTEYPQDLIPPHSTDTEYEDDSFFGENTDILWEEKDLHTYGRIDMAATRKSGTSATGGGVIFKTTYVIIVDLIIGRAVKETPFTVKVSNPYGLDSAGNPIDINVGDDATFIIVDNTISGNENTVVNQKTTLSPNPARGTVTVATPDLKAKSIRVVNTFGQTVLLRSINSANATLDISGLDKGLYLAEVQTEEGTAVKKLLVE